MIRSARRPWKGPRQRRRVAPVVVIVCLVVTMIWGCGDAPTPPGGSPSASGVRALVETMERGGEACIDLVIETPPTHEETVGEGMPPAASEIGYCVLEDAAEVDGLPVASRILVFADEEHIKYLRAQSPALPTTVVYGDTWQIHVEPPGKAEEVRKALAGLGARAI